MNKISRKLEDKIALITGAAGLLGSEHAEALLELGAKICLTDINEKSLLEKSAKLESKFPSDSIITFQMDVTNIKSIISVRDSLLEYDTVDILINNVTMLTGVVTVDNSVAARAQVLGTLIASPIVAAGQYIEAVLTYVAGGGPTPMTDLGISVEVNPT